MLQSFEPTSLRRLAVMTDVPLVQLVDSEGTPNDFLRFGDDRTFADLTGPAGLPLADPARHHDAVMRNLVGPEGLAAWPGIVRRGRAAAHLYGKAEARSGRKLGHATRLLPLGGLAGLSEEELASEL